MAFDLRALFFSRPYTGPSSQQGRALARPFPKHVIRADPQIQEARPSFLASSLFISQKHIPPVVQAPCAPLGTTCVVARVYYLL